MTILAEIKSLSYWKGCTLHITSNQGVYKIKGKPFPNASLTYFVVSIGLRQPLNQQLLTLPHNYLRKGTSTEA